jgi:hypothetical protein
MEIETVNKYISSGSPDVKISLEEEALYLFIIVGMSLLSMRKHGHIFQRLR